MAPLERILAESFPNAKQPDSNHDFACLPRRFPPITSSEPSVAGEANDDFIDDSPHLAIVGR